MTISKLLFVFLCSLFLGGQLLSQEKSNYEYEDIAGGTRKYRYITDDLGYFDKLHGTQEYYRHKYPGSFEFDIECDFGIPESFSFSAEGFPVSVTNTQILGTMTSRGLYDQDGISALFSLFSHRDMKRIMFAYRLGNRITFRSELVIDREKQIQYGWINGDDQCIVSICDETADNSRYSTSNSIIYHNVIFVFSDKGTMDDFYKLVKSRQYEDVIMASKFQISPISKGMISESLWAPGFTRWDCYSGFTQCRKHESFPNNLFYIPIGSGKDDELHYLGLNYDLNRITREAYVIEKNSKSPTDDDSIVFLTNEQYEKYKDRVVYDIMTHRHGVKKADGTYLYVPDEIESGIIKTDAERALDKREENRIQFDLQRFEMVREACMESSRDLEKLGLNLDVQAAEEFEGKVAPIFERLKKNKEMEEAMRQQIREAVERRDFDTFDNLYEQVADQGKASLLEAAVLAAIESDEDPFVKKHIQKLTGYDCPEFKKAFVNSVAASDYSKASLYGRYLKLVGTNNDWFIQQIDKGKNTNAVVYNITYSNDRDLELGTYSEIIRGVTNDCLMSDDYSYILKAADYYDNELLNVIAAVLSAKENNHELAFKYISKVNNFGSAIYMDSNNAWSFRWGQITLISSNSCPADNCKDNVLLFCCALLDKKGESMESFKLCKKRVLFEAVDANWDYYSTSPGIVVNAILNNKDEIVSNHSFLISFLESLDPTKYEKYVKLLNEGWHTITADSSARYSTDPNIRSIFSILQYSAGFVYMRGGQYDLAINCFENCYKYADYKERIKECKANNVVKRKTEQKRIEEKKTDNSETNENTKTANKNSGSRKFNDNLYKRKN